MTRHSLMLVAVAAGIALACAAGTQAGTRSGGSRDVITTQQLMGTSTTNALDAVRRLRPRWLRPRSGNVEAVLFLDNVRRGDLQQLATVGVESIEEIRYISPSDATTRWGTGYSGGVIQVLTKR